MGITLKVRAGYAELHGINIDSIPLPYVGESLREYVSRAELGKETDILAVINRRAKSFDHCFADGDVVEIYPMVAGG